jgi:DNA polymerase III subunit delta
MSAAPLTVVRGEDPVLRSDVVSGLVDELLAGADRSLALDDLEIETRGSEDDRDDDSDEREGVDLSVVERIMVALASPPFLTERRVVVVRNVGGLSKSQCEMIVAQFEDPTPGVSVILEHRGGRMPSPLEKFMKAHKLTAVVPEAERVAAESSKKKGADRRSVVEVELQRALIEGGVKLDSEARRRIVEHLGDDAGRVHELVAVFATRFPLGATVRAADVEPYLGEVGTVASNFELTGAIEQGDAPTALDVLHRLMHATSAKHDKPNHPIFIMAALTSYYRSLLRIDSPDVNTKEDAAAILGGNPWAAKYRLDALRRIGSAGLRQAYDLIAAADLDLRGGDGTRAIDAETVMQLLVARLCALHRGSGRAGGAKAPATASRGRR